MSLPARAIRVSQLGGPAQLAALDRLEAEHGNLLAALSWSLETKAADPASDERVSIGLRLAQALAPFWYKHGHATEGRRWLQRAIDLISDDAGAPQARLAHWLGMLLVQQDELSAAVRLFERSLAIWTGLGDLGQQVRELNSLGGARCHLGDLDTARSLLEDSGTISGKIGSDEGLARALGNLGQVEIVAGNLDRAAPLLQEALVLNRKREDSMRVAHVQHLLA